MKELELLSKNIVFIIAQHRTGSTWLKNILDSSESIVMLHDEMNLYEPFRRDTLNYIFENISSIPKRKQKFRDQEIYGTFWKDPTLSGLSAFDIDQCFDFYRKSPLNFVGGILEKTWRNNGSKKYVGVKYPTHVRALPLVIDKFPQAKIIILNRNLSDSLLSKLNDSATLKRKSKSKLHDFIWHHFTFYYYVFEHIYFKKISQKHGQSCLSVSYEDLLRNHQCVIENIGKYLEIELCVNLSSILGKTSSHAIDHGSKGDYRHERFSWLEKAIINCAIYLSSK